jgi:AraC-like DNA-binding protein
MFVQALRAHLANEVATTPGWLRGLADPSLGRAIAEVHARPGRPWTVASLAQVAGASRSLFASRFRELVGLTVMDYVTALRMHMAAGLLDSSDSSLSDVASAVGYDSDISFGRAFKRWSGKPPGTYRRQLRSPDASHR